MVVMGTACVEARCVAVRNVVSAAIAVQEARITA
jgi:hypothetical protein